MTILNKTLKILTLIITGFILFNLAPAFGQEASGGVFTQAKKLMREGRFRDAGKLIAASVHEGEDKSKADGFMAVAQYASPDWDPDDISEIEKTKIFSIPLIADIAAQDPPEGAGKLQSEWIINTKIKFIAALGKLKYDKAIPALAKMGDSRDARIRFISLKALAAMKNSAAYKAIFDYLLTEHLPDYKSGNTNQQLALESQTRTIAIGTLAEAADPGLEAELAKKVKERKSADRLTAAIILTGYRSPEYMDLYTDLLKEEDPALRLYAAAALREMGYNEGFSTLKSMFESSDTSKRLGIVSAIGSWGNQESIQFLIDYMDKESSGRSMGYVPINLMGKTPDPSTMTDMQVYLYTRIVQILMDNNQVSAPLLLEILKSGKKSNIAYFAAEVLGESRYKPAKEVFIKNLDSKDPMMVYYSIFGLSRMKDKGSSAKFKSLLSSTDPHISAAAAWGLAKMGDASGRSIALKNLTSKNPVLSSAAMDTLIILKNPSDTALICNTAKKGLPLIQDMIAAVRFPGIMADQGQMEFLRIASAGDMPISFYAAESIFRITGMPALYSSEENSPENAGMYGAGIYDTNSYARYYLLYMTLDPGLFGKLNEVRYGYVTPLRRYGEFGQVEDKSPANPIIAESGTNQAGKPAGELQPGKSVVVRKISGSKALVTLNDGTSGWTLLAGLDIVDGIIASTSRRIRKDLGFNRKEDLEDILKKDYIKTADFLVEQTSPKSAANSDMALFALDMGERFSGNVNPDSRIWDEIILGINSGKRIVTIDRTIKNEKWIFTFDAAGNLESIKNQ